MSAPLKKTITAEDSPADQIPAPLELETPVAEPTAEVARSTEPSLFGELDVEEAAAHDQAEDIFDDVAAEDDGLPLPAYQPQVPAFEPPVVEDEVAETFVAPRAPAPGTPSPEAIVRLQAAAQKASPQMPKRPVAPAHDTAASGGDRARFGLNSLIHRMTGHAGDTPAQPAAQTVRQQPPVQRPDAAAQPQPEPNPDQERIEIPAFLRRQAN
jgi:cell division protein FtsZ